MAYSKVKTIVVERDGEELDWREEISTHSDLLQTLGIIAEDKITISGGSLDPSVDGFPGDVGSAYFSTNGNIYKKVGSNDTDWIVFTGGSLPSGGLTGQVLTKLSNTDGDADWENTHLDGGYF